MNLKKILFSVGLALSACLLLGQSTITVPPGKGWSAALRNAGLPVTSENVAALEEIYGDPQPETYVFPGTLVEQSGARMQVFSPLQEADSYWNWEQGHWHHVQPGQTIRSIGKDYGCPSGWEAICDSAILFENGLRQRHIIHPDDILFIPPLAPYANDAAGVIKIPINRGMTLYSLRGWLRNNYGDFAETSLLYSPQVYVNGRNEYEWRDITTRQVVTVYTYLGAMYQYDPRLYEVVFRNLR